MSSVSVRGTTSPHWVSDYVQLTKPRILVMILLTVGAGAACTVGSGELWWPLAHTLIGTALVAAAASIINQVMERDSDSAMRRTADRPLPAGRLTIPEAAAFGAICLTLGCIDLFLFATPMAALVALATFVLYVALYTPLKQRSVWNTAAGTLPGALPVLIGCLGVGGSFANPSAWLLVAIVICWQFPHFMAIAWLYREDYARGGYRMWTTEEKSGRVAGAHAVLGAVALLPLTFALVSLAAPGFDSPAAWVAVALMMLPVATQLIYAIGFSLDRNDRTARRLLRSSLLVLPLILIVFVSLAA